MEKRILGVLTIVFFILGMTGSVFAADKVTLDRKLVLRGRSFPLLRGHGEGMVQG